MEQLAGGGATRFRHQRSPERFLGIFHPQSSSHTPPSPIELSEDDIFNTSSGSSSRPQIDPNSRPDPKLKPISIQKSENPSGSGILAALIDNRENRLGSGSGSGPEIRPVFNHKASVSASILSSSIKSPAASISSRMDIPSRPPKAPDRVGFQQNSAPVNIPVRPGTMRRTSKDFDDVVLDEEELNDGVIMPPHEVVASRHSPMLACSVLEGAGRTLKGRDLRQVRNAIWRKTGFID